MWYRAWGGGGRGNRLACGGVGRVEGASVNGWSLGAVNAAAMCAFRVGAGGGSRLRRARAAFRSWVVIILKVHNTL